ncbi:MAG TPA: nucleotidyl transferase AbiEii/AbiGii toxin family protein [Kofleriaceae bacterium]
MDALVAFADVAEKLGLRWYVFGAQAVNLHGFPRATADLDLTIDLAELPPRALIAKLEKAGFSARFSDDEFIAATRVIPMVHRATKLPIDLVIAGPGLEQRFLDEVQLHPIGNRRVPVLSPENLIVTKLLAARPKDLEDVRELLASRGSSLHHDQIGELLALLEQALDQSDLTPLYQRLRDEAARG